MLMEICGRHATGCCFPSAEEQIVFELQKGQKKQCLLINSHCTT